MKILELKIPPVVVFLLCGVLMWSVSAVFPGASFAFSGSIVMASALAVAGGIVGLIGVRAFRRHDTTVNPTKPHSSNAVVSSGIYGYTRNPMYLGLLLGLIGWALFLENSATLVALPAFVAYMNYFQIKPEERALLANFGSDYSTYMSGVRRWM